MRKKIENIQALRGIAILFVLGFHLLTVEQKYGHGYKILPDFLKIGMSGVDLFFIISGFVMVTVTRGRFGKPIETGVFLYNRLTRIYPIYWFYSLLVLVVYLMRPDMVNQSQGNQVNVVASFLLLPQDKLPLVMVGWTLIHEMYFYFAFAAILLAKERHLIKWLFCWVLIVAASNFIAQIAPSLGTGAAVKVLLHPMTLEFIAGCLIAKSLESFPCSYGVVFGVAGIVSLAVGWSVYYSLYPDLSQDTWLRILLLGLPSAMIVYGAIGMEIKGLVLPKLLRDLGDASYSIYLSHILILTAVGRSWAKTSLQGGVVNAFVLPVILASAIAAGIASYHFLEKPMMSFFRRKKASVISLVPETRADQAK